MSKTLVIADDHALLRDALEDHATRSGGFRVVASVGDAQAAVNACRAAAPDLLVLDLDMPGRDALAALADLRAVSPHTRIVILTAYCRDTDLELALQAKVDGVLLKSDSPSNIISSLLQAFDGSRVFSRPVQDRLAPRSTPAFHHSNSQTRLAALTPRELEVLRGIARGLDNEQMAQNMSISKRTVERHVARLMDAIDIRDRTAIIRFAYEQGLAA